MNTVKSRFNEWPPSAQFHSLNRDFTLNRDFSKWNFILVTRFNSLHRDFSLNWDSLNRDFTIHAMRCNCKFQFFISQRREGKRIFFLLLLLFSSANPSNFSLLVSLSLSLFPSLPSQWWGHLIPHFLLLLLYIHSLWNGKEIRAARRGSRLDLLTHRTELCYVLGEILSFFLHWSCDGRKKQDVNVIRRNAAERKICQVHQFTLALMLLGVKRIRVPPREYVTRRRG